VIGRGDDEDPDGLVLAGRADVLGSSSSIGVSIALRTSGRSSWSSATPFSSTE
jgi:hypothetical protein